MSLWVYTNTYCSKLYKKKAKQKQDMSLVYIYITILIPIFTSHSQCLQYITSLSDTILHISIENSDPEFEKQSRSVLVYKPRHMQIK